MMDVLLANVKLWTGRMAESVVRGREAIALFQEIGDRWGEVMATGPVVRSLAELGRDAEYADTLAHYRSISRDIPDEGMRTFPEVLESLVDLQQGRPEAAEAILSTLDLLGEGDSGQLGFADVAAAVGLAMLQLGQVAEAIDLLERGYAEAAEDGPAMVLGSRLALAYTAAHRPGDAATVIDAVQHRDGGTFSDRVLALWAESFAAHPAGRGRRARAGRRRLRDRHRHRRATRARHCRAGEVEGAARARRRRRDRRRARRRLPPRAARAHRRRLGAGVRPRARERHRSDLTTGAVRS